MSLQAITHEEFVRMCEFLYRKTGIVFDLKKIDYVQRRVVERMEATGAASFRGYFARLDSGAGAGELQQLINLMTINETFFFREEYQLRCLVHSLLDEVVQRRRSRSSIRIWSVPCSTGEEPYSVAIYLLEQWPRADDFDIQILGSDIDTEALTQAQRGLYGSRSVTPLPAAYCQKYFSRAPGGEFQICEQLRGSVEFSRVNLTDPQQTEAYRDFDVIFCRNLLIYYDDLSRQQVVGTLYKALSPGGFICLGHSESMSRISPLFTMRKFPDAIVYQRPLEERAQP